MSQVEKGARDVTQLLVDWSHGDRAALEELMPLVYDKLHRLAERHMRRQRADHTLQPTALVHEAFLQLIDQKRVSWQNRQHFFGVAARLMRRVTTRYARARGAAKRGAGLIKVPFEAAAPRKEARAADVLALDEALERLERLDPRQCRIVELRFFGGCTVGETAELLDISESTVHREWRLARAWLQREIES